MKLSKILLPIIIILVIVLFSYSFFHIGGDKIKFTYKLSEAKTVTVMVVNEENGKKTYQITEDGKTLLLLEQNRLQQQCENGQRVLGGMQS